MLANHTTTMLRCMDQIKTIQWKFELLRSENRQNLGEVTYRTMLLSATIFFQYSDNKRSVQMKHIS